MCVHVMGMWLQHVSVSSALHDSAMLGMTHTCRGAVSTCVSLGHAALTPLCLLGRTTLLGAMCPHTLPGMWLALAVRITFERGILLDPVPPTQKGFDCSQQLPGSIWSQFTLV
ncbi:hypothetical protein KIL84_001806 [Mauremys mutica]|uniref:Uncharacterized protein n=1 Tax=Mauremys mutica TaxID=74926 RepID=A0A9D3XJK8_9SAUR|nr:hypothetical protein KIL84_001806 [Mauremys mutica]